MEVALTTLALLCSCYGSCLWLTQLWLTQLWLTQLWLTQLWLV